MNFRNQPYPIQPHPKRWADTGPSSSCSASSGSLSCLASFSTARSNRRRSTPPVLPQPFKKKLHALVSRAATGDLPDGERARLERLILGHWKGKIPALESLAPAEALVKLRGHPEASPLILKLEEWLHAPNPSFFPGRTSPPSSPPTSRSPKFDHCFPDPLFPFVVDLRPPLRSPRAGHSGPPDRLPVAHPLPRPAPASRPHSK